MRWLVAVVTLVGCPAAVVPVVPTAPAEVTIPDPMAARQALVDALSSGKPERVWALMGPGPRARFGAEDQFRVWCTRYCAEWLVQVLAGDDQPRVTLRFGDVQLAGIGDRFEVEEAPFLPTRRTAEDALGALRHTLVRLADDATFAAPQRAAWLRLAEGLARALENGIRVTAGAPMTVDGGAVVLEEHDGQWSVTRFEVSR